MAGLDKQESEFSLFKDEKELHVAVKYMIENGTGCKVAQVNYMFLVDLKLKKWLDFFKCCSTWLYAAYLYRYCNKHK